MTDKQVDLRFVRDNFGHSSISTTRGVAQANDQVYVRDGVIEGKAPALPVEIIEV